MIRTPLEIISREQLAALEDAGWEVSRPIEPPAESTLCEFDEAAQSLYCVRCGAWVKNEQQHGDFHADLDRFRGKELGG